MKKFLAAILAAILWLTPLTSCTHTKDPEELPEWAGWPESPLADFEYERADDGLSMHIRRYVGSDEVVVIPSHIEGLPVTALVGWELNIFGDIQMQGTFAYSTVKTVVLPETLVSIGKDSFYKCENLTEVRVMPGSALKVIGESAFTICPALAILDIAATPLEAIEKDALKGCTGLSAISLPDTVTEIGDGAFAACFALKELDLPDSLVSLGVDGFMGCKALWRISIPAKLDLTADGGPRFLGLPSLYSLTFDQGRESLEGSDYFEFRGMVGITIPAGVRKFSPGIFTAQDGASLHIWFEGDCPEITGDSPFPENADITIYYDPNTAGWEECVWKGQYEMIPEDPLE